MGDDLALLDIVTSPNIACGFHAGDAVVMARTMRVVAKRGVGIGAYSGFSDMQGFGRRRISLPGESLSNLIRNQAGAAQGLARAMGADVRHLKLHGTREHGL